MNAVMITATPPNAGPTSITLRWPMRSERMPNSGEPMSSARVEQGAEDADRRRALTGWPP